MGAIKINAERKKFLIGKTQEYFWREHELELGDLAASFVLDFIAETIAPDFYNQGVEDAYALMTSKTEDLLSLQIIR